MARNMIVRLGVDASDFQKKMAQAGMTADATGKKIRKGLNVDNLGAEVAKIMGWSGQSSGVGSITAQNVGIAQNQLGILRSYRDQLAGAGFDDYQFGLVSERIKALEYDIDAYSQSLNQAADAEQEVAQETSRMGQEAGNVEPPVTKTARAFRSMEATGHRLNIIPGFLRKIADSSDHSNNRLERMVRTIRNVSVVSFGLRVAKGLFGEFSTIIRNHISQDAALQAQVNGLSASLGQTLAPAISLVTNALSYVLPYVLGVSNAISSLMGALFGGGWSAAEAGAKKTAAATGGAAKAQKEMNRQLLSFDQINRMESQKDTGGGGGSGAAIAPIEAKTPAWAERLKKNFTELFESAEFQAANVGGKIGMTLNLAISEAYNALSGVDFTGVGTTLAENFNSAIENIDWNQAGQLLGLSLLMLPSILVGFVQSADWPLVGTSVSQFLIGSLNTVSGWIRSVDWLQLGQTLRTFVDNIDYEGIAQSLGTAFGLALGALGSVLWGFIQKPWEEFSERLKSNTELLGGDAVNGFFWTIGESLANVGTWLWENFCKPIIDGVKEGFGIHSPSKVFGEIGTNCIDSLTDNFGNGVEKMLQKIEDLKTKVNNAANKLKEAFSFEWSLPHLRLPHLSVQWDPVDNVLAQFFGVTAFPRLSVQWFAKGGILDGAQIFGRMGSTLLGGGERGREAILPLDTNTGWMDVLARRIAANIGTDSGGDVNATINLMLDGDLLTSYVMKGIRRKSRAGTASI